MQVDSALDRSGLDKNSPTFILAECVLVYMKPEESEALVRKLAGTFSSSVIVVRGRQALDLLPG
jgi:O-methyltransferase involved in polyketide biosynthesis